MKPDIHLQSILAFMVAGWLALCPLSVVVASETPVVTETPKGLETLQMAGVVGPYRVGVTLIVRDQVEIEDGRYYYVSKLADIPLQGHAEGQKVTLQEPGGGVFHLHLVTNDSGRGQPLTFYNSTGLQGDWTQGAKTLPVRFTFVSSRSGPMPDRWYEGVSDESDAAFERRVRTFLHAVIAGDRVAAAGAVSYPLRINLDPPERPLVIRNRAQLLANWSRVFTPGLISRLKDAVPHEMFVRQGLAMFSDGIVWFDARGAAVINGVN